MLAVANGWDGVWASVIGGLIGGATVAISLGVTLRHEKATRKRDEDQEARRARRQAANELLIAVHDLRDEAVHSRRGATGEFSLWPLRKQLLLTQVTLGELPAYNEAKVFYSNASAYRDWARKNGPSPDRNIAAGQRADLDRLGQQVMWLLLHRLEDPHAVRQEAPLDIWF